MRVPVTAASLFFALICGCSTTTENIMDVDTVIMRSAELSGQRILVEGYLKYEFEDHNLYAAQRYALEWSRDHCISIGLSRNAEPDLESASGQWVIITGILSNEFCPPNSICTFSCSQRIGVFVENVQVRSQ